MDKEIDDDDRTSHTEKLVIDVSNISYYWEGTGHREIGFAWFCFAFVLPLLLMTLIIMEQAQMPK